MVLAIGLLVDDAIVVVENVERIMRDEGLPAREATEKSMGEISGRTGCHCAGVVSRIPCLWPSLGDLRGNLSSVFDNHYLRNAAFRGSGIDLDSRPVRFRPPACSAIKKAFSAHLTAFYHRTEDKYQRGVIYVLRRAARTMGLYVVLGGGMALMIVEAAGQFLPTEDRAKSWCSTRCR